MNYRIQASTGAIALALASGLATPALAQDAGADIIVTAQRVEQRLQDVPISITVFNGDQLQKRNIAVASDLAAYTPSLAVNTRFGPEKATFAIRGFNQDASTAPTVGVYFADVVGVRAQGGTAGGNSVGAGAFTDLQNVQVLKGPQGTLFGRNTTGGSILLVPKKPTGHFEGYAEGTIGNYNERRIEAAINIPLAETFKVRLSIDRNERDGYMKNHATTGPRDYNDINYIYGRLSIVADLTPDLENYTIVTYSRSDTNGYASHYEKCNTDATSPAKINPATISPSNPSGSPYGLTAFTSQSACAQIARQAARGDGPLDVEVGFANPRIFLRQWQAINTTTWHASDTMTVKNIVSYGEYREQSAFSLYSDNFQSNPFTGAPFQYITLDTQPDYNAAAGRSTTEELQFQGRSADDRLNYVIGGYLEFGRPLGWNQQRTGIYGNCTSPGTLQCVGGLPLIPLPANALFPGSPATTLNGAIISESRTQFKFNNHGIFAQATYKITPQISLTGGFRYTFDSIVGYAESNRYTYGTLPAAFGGSTNLFARSCNDSLHHPAPGAANATPTNTVNLLTNGGDTAACGTTIPEKSSKPTWLVDVDYKPNSDILLYGKYARGYRQGTVNFTNPGLEVAKPEKLDTFEIGGKFTFRGSVPGYFNIAGFYNNFTNQQIFGALIAKANSGLAGGAAIINAGKTSIKGIEVDTGATVGGILNLTAGYAYLDTKIKDLIKPTLDANSPFADIIPRGTIGGELSFSPHHRLTVAADLKLPTPETFGKLSVGAIWTYTSSQLVDGNATIPSTSLLNLNATLANIAGTGVDLIGFATNVTNTFYKTTSGGGFESSGILDYMYGPPRMYGMRLRVSFGGAKR